MAGPRHTLITTVPIIANAIDPPLSRSLIARLMDAQHGFLRPFHTKFGSWMEAVAANFAAVLTARRN
jgi:hypothetical protein